MEKKKKTFRLLVSLIDKVFSWSIGGIEGILNTDLYKQQIKTVPDKFSTVDEYLKCFVPHVLEETRTELCSNFKTIERSPVFRTLWVARCPGDAPFSVHYRIKLMAADGNSLMYKPKCGDLFALTKDKPSRIDDLNPLVLAHVFEVHGDLMISVQLSKSIRPLSEYSNSFGVFLMGLSTNTRIWNALHNKKSKSVLLKRVLEGDTTATKQRVKKFDGSERVLEILRSMNLNSSQEAAILGCIKTRNCSKKKSLKLIWGPPGTGKTKTVATLLFVLLKLNCKTVVCAPTNTAVVEVASRLLALVRKNSSSEDGTYRPGNIILSGDRGKMGIDMKHDLLDVFIDERINKLDSLFSPIFGWNRSLKSLTQILEDPQSSYRDYVDNLEGEAEDIVILSFGEYARKLCNDLTKKLEIYMVDMYTHLPESDIPSKYWENMNAARDAFGRLRHYLEEKSYRDDFKTFERYISDDCMHAISALRELSLPRLHQIPKTDKERIRLVCPQKAHIIFCTASGAADLKETGDIELLVVDEAAQLKECESVATLQLPGLRHAILIGDELQLPAMVQNEVCEKEKFGRSLFERLVLLGQKKHLLDVQ